MKFIRLIYNEIFKQIKKKSFMIAFLLILLFCIAFPIINKATESDSEHNYDKYEIEYLEKNPRTFSNKLEQRVYNDLTNIKISGLKQRQKLDIADSNYRYNLVEEVINLKYNEQILSYLIEGISAEDLSKVLKTFEDYPIEVNSYAVLTNEELLKEKASSEKERTKLENVILNDDYSYYIDKKIKETSNMIKENNDVIKTSKSKEKIKSLNNDNRKQKEILKVYNYLKEKNIKNSNDFRIIEAGSLVTNIEEYYAPMLSKKELAGESKISYSDYKKVYNDKKEALKEKIDKSWYMIKTNKNHEKAGVKISLESSLDIIVFLSILSIIIAGGIVSSEFQKGTIRLLVVRPNKRWKLLLSKFIAFLLITLIIVLITTAVCILANGFVYGFGDYATNALIVKNGSVVEINYICSILKEALLLSIPVFFVGVGTFMLSTITVNTAMSVGLGMCVMFAYPIAIELLALLHVPFIDLLFLPYIDFATIIDAETLSYMSLSLGSYMSFSKAILVLVIWSILFYFLSNLVFVKRDIKN